MKNWEKWEMRIKTKTELKKQKINSWQIIKHGCRKVPITPKIEKQKGYQWISWHMSSNSKICAKSTKEKTKRHHTVNSQVGKDQTKA